MTADTTSKPCFSFTQSTDLKPEHATSKPQGRPTANVARKRSAHAGIQRMRVVGYCRVSTNQQPQEGVSLDAQRARVKAHCISQGIKLVDIITDERAVSLRAQGLSLRQLGERLRDQRILPRLSDAWHAASIRDLLLDAERRSIAA